MRNVQLILILSSALGLSACSMPKNTQKIQMAAQANQEADSYLAWESNDYHPTRLFVKWNSELVKGEVKPSELCADFEQASTDDLVMFENEIRSTTNTALLADCQKKLVERLDAYWAIQKTQLVDEARDQSDRFDSSPNYRFRDDVQYRDLREGYFGYSGDVQKKEVILTLDDGPSGQYTESILETMAAVNAKGVFFMVGGQAKKYPDLVKRVASEGHTVGAHSMSHKCLAFNDRCKANNGGHALTLKEAVADIRGSFYEIFKVLGFVDPFFRFPYGESSPELKKFLASKQVGEFYWSIDSNDWRSKDKAGRSYEAPAMIASVMSELKMRGKGMILIHDVQKKTMIALPELLRRIYTEGYNLVLLKPSGVDRENPKILD